MSTLTGANRRYLRSQANRLQAKARVGKHGLTEALVRSVDEILTADELAKVKFVERKDEKQELAQALAERTDSEQVGMVGHVLLLYRQQPDPEQRTFQLPD
jgi:RNA-binding protein